MHNSATWCNSSVDSPLFAILTQGLLDDGVALVAVAGRVEAPHLDAVLCVGLELCEEVTAASRPQQGLLLVVGVARLVRLVVHEVTLNGGLVHRQVLQAGGAQFV